MVSTSNFSDALQNGSTTPDIEDCASLSQDPMAPYKLLNFSVMMIVSLVGLVGNLLAILTFHRQKRKTSATTFLKYLAAFDMLLIVTTNLFSHRYAYTLVFPSSWVNHFKAGILTIAVLPISYMCQSISTWTVVGVTLDRYIHVCHPLKAAQLCKITIASRIVYGIIIISVIYNVPRFFEYYKILEVAGEAIDPCSGYFHIPDHTLGGNMAYQYSYAFGMYMALMYVLPLGSLIFFNGKLIRKLSTMRVPGTEGKVMKLRGSDKIIPSLIAIVTLFLICQVPDMVLQILWRINSPFAPTFSIIAYDFIIINSSVNFIIYVIAADGFRKSLAMNVLPCLRKMSSVEDTNSSSLPTARWRSKQKCRVTDGVSEDYSSDVTPSEVMNSKWRQLHSNPTPIEEDDEEAPATRSGDDLNNENDVFPLKKQSSDVWIGGERKPQAHEKEEDRIEGAACNTILPDGTCVGVTGVYIVTQDPLVTGQLVKCHPKQRN